MEPRICFFLWFVAAPIPLSPRIRACPSDLFQPRLGDNCRWLSGCADEKDLVIIGGGVAGYVAAIKAGQEGMKVSRLPSFSTPDLACAES